MEKVVITIGDATYVNPFSKLRLIQSFSDV